MTHPRSRFADTNVPAHERTIVRVALVGGGMEDAHVTIYAQGRKGFERRPLDRVCARVRQDLRADAVAIISRSPGVSQRWRGVPGRANRSRLVSRRKHHDQATAEKVRELRVARKALR
jgi:hypothetical protein